MVADVDHSIGHGCHDPKDPLSRVEGHTQNSHSAHTYVLSLAEAD
jgi:hypothetical protein